MFKKFSVLGIMSIFVVSSLSACTSTTTTNNEPGPTPTVIEATTTPSDLDKEAGADFIKNNELQGNYELVSLRVSGENKDIKKDYNLDKDVNLKIEEDGKISGKICNDFSVEIFSQGAVNNVVSTKKACEDNVMDVENNTFNTFDGIATVNTDNNLEFIGISGNQSVWKKSE